VLEGEERRRSPAGYADLGVDVLHVVLGGAGRDDERVGHLPVGKPPGDQAEHLDLPVRQPGRPGSTRPDPALPGGLDHRGGALRVEPARPRRRLHLPGRLGGIERRPVGPVLGHRLVDVGGGQHPRPGWDLLRGGAAVVAGAVLPLVVHPRRAGQRLQDPGPG
jgi:hypothetical protein